MNRENAKQNAAIMLAYSEGKPIQMRIRGVKTWKDSLIPDFNFCDWEYRVKPEPTYRPYKDAKEFTKDVIAKGPVINDKNGMRSIIASFADNFVFTVGGTSYTYKALLQNFHWALDDSPCGVLDENTQTTN